MIQKIVRDLHNGVQNSRKTIEFLQTNSSFTWVADYPTAVVNEKNRITDENVLKKLEEIDFFNAESFSERSYTQKEINYLKENIPEALKTTYCLCLNKKQTKEYTFKEKFEHDRWKKVTDDDFNFEAFVEVSKFKEDDTSVIIETELRDIMRSAKEIPALKAIGFVWIVTLPKTQKVEDILEHYFEDNHIFVEQGRKIVYLAWNARLADINMRYFVNTP